MLKITAIEIISTASVTKKKDKKRTKDTLDMQSSTPLRGVLKLCFTDCMLNGKKQTFHKDVRTYLNVTIIKNNGERRQQRIHENDKVDAAKVTSGCPLLHLNHEIISAVV